MDNPYEQPGSEVALEQHVRPVKGARTTFAFLGTVMAFMMVPGLVMFITGFFGVFEEVVINATTDPKFTAGRISASLVPLIFCLMFAIPGMLICIVLATTSPYRAPWFFWTSMFLSIVFVLVIPIGTIFGLPFLIFLISRRSEFRRH